MRFDPFAWWNAVYTLPLAFVLVVLTLTSLASLVGGAFGGQEAEAETEVEADAEIEADVEVDAEVEADVEADADLDGDGHVSTVEHATAIARGHGGESSPLVSGLVLLGVGRAPFMLLMQLLLLLWGVVGIGLHQAFAAAGPAALAWSVPITLVVSLAGTRGFAQVFGRYIKQFETSAVRRDQIVGRSGRVVYPVTTDEGTVSVRDGSGTLHRVRARSQHGMLDSGQQIIIVGYDPESRVYQVDDASAFVDRP